jgi:hypothetical protein
VCYSRFLDVLNQHYHKEQCVLHIEKDNGASFTFFEAAEEKLQQTTVVTATSSSGASQEKIASIFQGPRGQESSDRVKIYV